MLFAPLPEFGEGPGVGSNSYLALTPDYGIPNYSAISASSSVFA